MKKRILIAVGGLLGLAAVAGIGWLTYAYIETSAPIRTSDTFLKSFLNDEASRAYAMTGESFKASTDEDEFKQVTQTASSLLDKSTLKLKSGDVKDNDNGTKLATLTYDVMSEGESYLLTVRVLMNPDTGKWEILNVENKRPGE